MKETADNRRGILAVAQMGADLGHELLLVPGALASNGVGLGVVVEELVGIEVGSVGGQEEDLDTALLGGDPVAHPLGAVDGMPVDDQEDLSATRLLEQSAQELEEHAQAELPLEDHEAQVAPVGDGRDHVATEPLTGSRNDRGLAPGGIRASGLVIGPQPHLVAPVKQGLVRLGPALDSRILDLHPVLDGHRIGLVGPAHRLLGSEPPPAQEPSHGGHRQGDPVALADQLANRRPCPQDKRQLQLVGTVVRDRPDNRPGHLGGHLSAAARSSLRSRPQRLGASLAMCRHPLAHRLPRNAEGLRRRHLRHPTKHGADRLLPHRFLCFRVPRSCVFTHAGSMPISPAKCKLFIDLISIFDSSAVDRSVLPFGSEQRMCGR